MRIPVISFNSRKFGAEHIKITFPVSGVSCLGSKTSFLVLRLFEELIS